MSDALSSNKLIESIKRRASIPESQATFTKSDFLEFANEELRLGLVPEIMSLHEDYLLFEQVVPLEVNKNDYEIPSRAIGNKLRDVQHKIDDRNYVEMTRIGIGERFTESNASFESNLKRYYLKNNRIILMNPVTNANTGFLAMVYYIKPSKLVEEDRVAIIQGINRTTGQLVLSSVPENFNLSVKYDFYKAESPHSILAIDLSAVSLNSVSSTLTFSPELLPANLQVGDHIALSGECIIPQVPTELQVMLAQMVACRVLESIGDREGLQMALLKLQQMKEAAGMIIDNRVEDSPKKIVNRHGILRTTVFGKRFNRR